MQNQLFREKSLEKVSSPEQLNDYIRVSNPGVWIAVAAFFETEEGKKEFEEWKKRKGKANIEA